ncbi:MAG: DNA mismatch repair endonuclease MutL, partial [Gammaproteobacteria bacterium]
MRIRPLSPTLANQIAAGEVIERPASVLKELVENALDADARRIVVDVERGGMALVRVRDDGEGIHKDDLELAVSRHATSKLAAFEDLSAIRTLGFRGEALPSIASVSRFELVSCRRGAEAAYMVKSDGSAAFDEPTPARHGEGSTGSGRDLFFNTPARRRFLRSEKTELRHIEQLLKRLALARFDVAFTLSHGGRALMDVRAAGTDAERGSRVARLCGRSFADAAVEVELDAADMRLSGWVAGPSAARAYTDLQQFYVNGRIVRDSVARHALRQAYQDLIPAGRHPAYVLYLEIDPGAVDVNVHPTKHEVRFRESRLVHDFLSRGVRRFISEARGMPGFEDAPAPAQAFEPGVTDPCMGSNAFPSAYEG